MQKRHIIARDFSLLMAKIFVKLEWDHPTEGTKYRRLTTLTSVAEDQRLLISGDVSRRDSRAVI